MPGAACKLCTSGGEIGTSLPRPPRLLCPPFRPAARASSGVHSCAVPFSWAARPPLLAISRCFSRLIEANPRRSLRVPSTVPSWSFNNMVFGREVPSSNETTSRIEKPNFKVCASGRGSRVVRLSTGVVRSITLWSPHPVMRNPTLRPIGRVNRIGLRKTPHALRLDRHDRREGR